MMKSKKKDEKEEYAEVLTRIIESKGAKADEGTVFDLLYVVNYLVWDGLIDCHFGTIGGPPGEQWDLLVECWKRKKEASPPADMKYRALAALLSRLTASGRAKELVKMFAEWLAMFQKQVLYAFAWREAEWAVEDNDPEHLVRGLVALAASGNVDPQNGALVLIGRSALLIRVPREAVFERAAAMAGEQAASALRTYAREAPRETARLIRRRGFKEVRDERGFRYEQDLAKTGWF